MKISYNWIRDYLKTDLEPSRIAEILTSIGLEIEGMDDWVSVRGGLEGVVVGEVITCRKHPDADKLSITTVDIGGPEPVQIVCGAPNVAEGQKVPVATTGTILYKGDERFEIKKSKIRGEISEGMICAEDELGLGTSHEGIMVLRNDVKPGTPARNYFNVASDVVFEIGLTPNRIDSGSHYGVARDLAAYLNINSEFSGRAVLPSVSGFKTDNNDNSYEVIIENTTDCPRYTGITISGITVGESPDWLKNRLRAVGLNPINNVVDITNFVQLEIGQPLHAFDADKITGKKVIIRNLPDKSKFVTLDNTERTLSSRDLMICNPVEGMCIAGVFGGIKSGVTQSTRNVFLESAYFNPVAIRKTSKRHSLKTDASFRFERGADPGMTTWALKRAIMLIREIAGGKISSEIIDVYPNPLKNAKVELTYSGISRLIGKKIEPIAVKKILGLLDIGILAENGDDLTLDIPSYRVDVKRDADVIEEVLRIYGYNNVEISSHVNSTLTFSEKPDREKVINIISDLLSANGFAEIMCNSLTPAAWYEMSVDFDKEKLVKLANPLSSDLNAMRQSLLFGGLQSIIWNINRQHLDLKFYEFGHCYFYDKPLQGQPLVDNYSEKESLDLFITGATNRQTWNCRSNPSDFFNIKSAVEMVLSRLGLEPESISGGESSRRYFAESLTYRTGNNIVAEAGRVSRSYLKLFDIEQDVYYAHIDWDLLLKKIRKHSISFRELPKYPSVRRDLALLLDRSIRFSQVRDLALKTERSILHDISLFDVYESDSLGNNKKSYAVSLILRDEMKTLTDKNIDKVMNNLIRAFESELNAHIR